MGVNYPAITISANSSNQFIHPGGEVVAVMNTIHQAITLSALLTR